MAKPVIKVSDLVNAGEYGFFAEVIKKFPKATTGDSDPYITTKWSIWNERIIIQWWRYNASDDYSLELDDGTILNEGE